MSKQIYSDESLERYLLGLLPEAETERMDELSFTDDAFAQALKAVEKDLVDAYVQGELSGVNLEQFKTVYLASPLRRDNVQFARAFQALAARGADATMTTEMPARSLNEPKNIRRFSALSILWPSRPAWQFGFALVLLLLIVTGWAFWRAVRNRETKTESASATPSPTPASLSATNENPTASPEAGRDDASTPVLTELNDGHGRLVLDQQGKVSGVDDLPPRYQELVKESLSGGRLERSSLLAGLNRTPSPLMGDGGEANRISVIEPVGKILESSRPTFRWSALPGTTGYYIEIYDEKFGRVATSPKLSANSWTPPQFL